MNRITGSYGIHSLEKVSDIISIIYKILGKLSRISMILSLKKYINKGPASQELRSRILSTTSD